MKKFIFSILIMICFVCSFGQNTFTYQAVVRDNNNFLVSNQNIRIRLSFLRSLPNGPADYVETQTAQTNANGLFTLLVGSGTTISGSMSNVDWSNHVYYLKSEIDPTGGYNYSISGVQLISSVPFAQYAANANYTEKQVLTISGDTLFLTGGTNSMVILPSNSSVVPDSISAFINDAGYITHFVDSQQIHLNGDTLILDRGGYVTLPLNNAVVPDSISAFINDAGYITHFVDSQQIHLNGDTLILDRGGSVIISSSTSCCSLVDSLQNQVDSLNSEIIGLQKKFDDFAALLCKPRIATTAAYMTYYNSGFGSGDASILCEDSISAYGFCWNTTGAPTLSDSYSVNGQGSATYNGTLYGLSKSQTYYVRAYATNSYGTYYGNELSFTTCSDSLMPVTTASGCGTYYWRGKSYNTSGTYIDSSITPYGCKWYYQLNLTIYPTYHITEYDTIPAGNNLVWHGQNLTSQGIYYDYQQTANGCDSIYELHLSTIYGSSCAGAISVTDVDNNVYNTVQIGSQCWMKENLRTSRYTSNGPQIPIGTSTSSTTAYIYYPNGSSSNVSTYGYLYNWAAIMNGESSSTSAPSGVQGICPAGWHIPSKAEWDTLVNYLTTQSTLWCNNISNNIANSVGTIGSVWNSPQTCGPGYSSSTANLTGFSAMPAGYTSTGTNYSEFGDSSEIWSATQVSTTSAYFIDIYEGQANLPISQRDKTGAQTVRCLKN